MALKHVLLIATGGTVACRDNGNGLAPALSGEQLIEFLPELSCLCEVVVENLFSKDSTDITTDDRVKIAHLIAIPTTNLTALSSPMPPIPWPIPPRCSTTCCAAWTSRSS